MATVLFAAELGYGFGHVSRLIVVAEALAAQGHTPVFAVGDVIETYPLLADRGWTVMQAPVSKALPRLAVTDEQYLVSSFADILYFIGYGNERLLTPLVRAWDALLAAVGPDLVVCDFSPTVCLAAAARVPTVAIGDGFSQPPSSIAEFPPMRPNVTAQCGQDAILAVVSAVQRGRGRPEPPRLPAIVAGDAEFVCVLPEFDPYRALVPGRTAGPLRPLPAPLPPRPGERRLFAYLSGQFAKVDQIAAGIAAAGCAGDVYLRVPTPKVLEAFAKTRLTVLPDVLPREQFIAAVARADAVVHHGGVGTSQDILALGRPQLICNMTYEQQLTADSLYRLGCGGRLRGGVSEQAIGVGLGRLVDEQAAAERATAVAREIAKRAPAAALGAIVAAAERLIARR